MLLISVIIVHLESYLLQSQIRQSLTSLQIFPVCKITWLEQNLPNAVVIHSWKAPINSALIFHDIFVIYNPEQVFIESVVEALTDFAVKRQRPHLSYCYRSYTTYSKYLSPLRSMATYVFMEHAGAIANCNNVLSSVEKICCHSWQEMIGV